MSKSQTATNGNGVKENLGAAPDEIAPGSSTQTTKAVQKLNDSSTTTIPIYKSLKIRIIKPLIPLKIALFLWYGAASALAIFLMVFYKKKGITLAELSTIYVITPAVQLLGPTLSGIIADKIGKPKPVLVANILLTSLIVAGMLLSPSLNLENCNPERVKIDCDHDGFGIKNTSETATECPENITNLCQGDGLFCKVLEESDNFDNFSVILNLNRVYEANRCYPNFTLIYKNMSYSWCGCSPINGSEVECWMNQEGCVVDNNGRKGILIYNTVLLILFYTMYSNTYRFMDVTTMFLVKEHESDFGVQRAFAVIGILVFSPVSGFIVDASTTEGEEKNYETALYFFIGMTFVLLAVVCKLEVRIRPPGQHMWKKSLYLLKNPDVITFALVLVVLGTAWSFNKNFLFWYLESMESPSFLLGIVNSISAVYGLPFLFVAHWWVKKIGTTRIFLLGLLGYVTSGVGYSLIYDPRLALLIELSNVFTYHLLWVAVVVYSHSIAPEGLAATVISTAGGIHFSIGRGTGGLIGGQVMSTFGGRIAFRVIALMCFSTGVLYAIYLFSRKMWKEKTKSININDGAQNSAFDSGESGQTSYAMKNIY